MTQTSKTIAAMYSAAFEAREHYGFIFMETDKGVSCLTPHGREQDAQDYIDKIKSITVAAVNHVDWPLFKANLIPSTNKDVLAVQAALDAAGLTSQVHVFANDGIKVNTNGPTPEIYQALLLLRTADITVGENFLFKHY